MLSLPSQHIECKDCKTEWFGEKGDRCPVCNSSNTYEWTEEEEREHVIELLVEKGLSREDAERRIKRLTDIY